MRIDWARPVQTAPSRREIRASTADSSFADAIASEPQATPAAAQAASTAIDGLFALQEVADELQGRRRAVARGNKLLDRLEELRIGMMSGTMPRMQLEALRHLAREHGPTVDDPQLASILSDIELRVAVELAKLDRSA
jgi:hypothetical protein